MFSTHIGVSFDLVLLIEIARIFRCSILDFSPFFASLSHDVPLEFAASCVCLLSQTSGSPDIDLFLFYLKYSR
jgi:hypothetical protein